MLFHKLSTFCFIENIRENNDDVDQNEFLFNLNRRDKNECINKLRMYIKQTLRKEQNIEFCDDSYGKRNKAIEDDLDNIQISLHQCFAYFTQALQNAKSLQFLNLSGMDINSLLAIELGSAIKKNSSLKELNLSGCKMNSSSLQYIFSSISNHPSLESINLYNNQGFNNDLIRDIIQFLFEGRNKLKKLKLTHCNISSTGLCLLLRNLNQSKSIVSLDISMMDFTTNVLISLAIALQHYQGKNMLEYLNIGYSNIKNQGLEILSQRVRWNFKKFNIKELILKRNFINQNGVPYLEQFLEKIAGLQKLDLSNNQIEEFRSEHLLQLPLYELNLSHNIFISFPQQFFMNTLVINLTNNNIQMKGAFQLSNILSQNPLWQELNISNNQIRSQGFSSLIFGLRENKILKRLMVANNNLDGQAMFTYMINHEQVSFELLDISSNNIRQVLIFLVLNYVKNGSLKTLKCQSLIQQQHEEQDFDNFGSETGIFQFFNVDASTIQNRFSKQKFQDLFQIASYTLRSLDFSGNSSIFPPVINSLTNYFNKMEVLNLSSCKPINQSDLNQLCFFLKNSQTISELDISNLGLGMLPFEALKNLRRAILLSSLKSVNLSKNKLSQCFGTIVSMEVIYNYRLEKMDYSSNGLKAKHVNFIEQILQSYKMLQELDLSYNKIDFCGLIMINQFQHKNATLQKLNLSNQQLYADDFLILSHLIGCQNLQSLDISNNNTLKRMKTFFSLCCEAQQHELKFSNRSFDKHNLQNAVDIIKKNRKCVQSLILGYSSLRKQRLKLLASELVKCKNIKFLSLTYNKFFTLDIDRLTDSLMKLKKIQVIHFQQINFIGKKFKKFAGWLKNIDVTSNLQTIEIRDCILTQINLNEISQGIAMNKTLKNLRLIQCNLGKLSLYQLGKAISHNAGLQTLSLDNNDIIGNLSLCKKAITEFKTYLNLKVLDISNNPIEKSSFVNLFSPKDGENQYLIIQELIMSNCGLTSFEFYDLEKQTIKSKNDLIFDHLLSLNLSHNQLEDEICETLAKFIQNMVSLEKLQLENNFFSSQGSIIFFSIVSTIKSLTYLNLSQNQIDDEFVFYLTKSQIKLKFLLLKGNQFTQKGQQGLCYLLKTNQDLFIDNIWSNIDDYCSDIILQQYTRLGQKYRLRQEMMPKFLKEIYLNYSTLTDGFCEIFGKYYPFLNFIELIDISDNPCITQYGKVYLFIHLFDISYEKHNLKAMYINDSTDVPKFFDDGILRYCVLKFNDFLIRYCSNQKKMKSFEKNSLLKNINCSFQVSYWINKFLFYLDMIQPQNFIVSTHFIGKFRKNNISIKILLYIFQAGFVSINYLQFRNLLLLDKDTLDCKFIDIIQSNCELNPSDKQLNIIYILISITLICVIDLIQLLLVVIFRKKIRPTLQIVSPKLVQNLQSTIPSLKEVLMMIYSILTKLQSLPERIFLHLIMIITNPDDLMQSYKIVFSVIIISRGIEELLTSFTSLIIFLKQSPQNNYAKYLSMLLQNLYQMKYYIASETLASFCPILGFQITKSLKINCRVIIKMCRIFFFEIPLLITTLQFAMDIKLFECFNFKNCNFLDFKVLLVLILVKSLVYILVSLFRILTIRPAIVKQNAFNLALAIKKFQQNKEAFVNPQNLKVEESIKTFIEISKLSKEQIIAKYRLLQITSEKSLDEEKEDIILEKEDQIIAKCDVFSVDSPVDQFDDPESPLKQSKIY